MKTLLLQVDPHKPAGIHAERNRPLCLPVTLLSLSLLLPSPKATRALQLNLNTSIPYWKPIETSSFKTCN